ncbi:MAG: 2-amino-4-hydroxy-6-hydroxymethyldihydropteridine diphosphokinase [Aquificae bacterium]|nr:2-amino-4-hydroxy-6-hydroxymethyldihydropteridine diphosphokinase [Aquificota bacterium]
MKVYLGLGSNVGERINYILRAIDEIKNLGEVKRLSCVYESEPWGVKAQPRFLNLVLLLETRVPLHLLLLRLKGIERKLGRRERGRWAPREIDIDILLAEDRVLKTKLLEVPHPFLHERDFFLYPLLEINPEGVHPLFKRPLSSFRVENKLKPFCCILKV